MRIVKVLVELDDEARSQAEIEATITRGDIIEGVARDLTDHERARLRTWFIQLRKLTSRVFI